ncbi:MAG: hypothetical protein U1F18_01800 [Steroidobacteraceae bacterium]
MDSSRLIPWLLVVALGWSGWHWLASRPQHWPPGVVAPDEPLQRELETDDARPRRRASFTATPRARLAAAVRVLSKEGYRVDPLAAAVPFDLAVGWGPMSDSAVIARLDISQSARFYSWRHAGAPPLPDREINRHSANWHVVPGNADVKRALARVRVGDIVELEGLLVDLWRDDGGQARTSLRRDDTGAGACEIIWVERLSVRYRD